MFKKYLGIPIFGFIFLLLKQIIFDDRIDWVYTTVFPIFLYVGYIAWEWINIPYKWKENKKQ
ncbi:MULTISPECIES: hypothetical protein [Oceanobacillus]|uniref:Uncharacterized protein n=1 Tax=Oceanobacillus kimchii TaxID=746691 RepID=A0ABQ5TMT8_9BACI|nr:MULTISPECIES: hypothetical protein [Oceanobacillus]MBT2600006.1 hypothetical protein [Oceanobacillus sp. ISL-74]MBT2652546.1 hypothetical protein [Oceanobacillus sp. ISL-73]MCT1577084.1 hypothetical protein [Oceanobacillus kimchii]MCT2135154.1 hypothetical protein [Oceanobacillus kimchii]GLO68121.1 hypothetical protein MACH08_39050 [Oceanobacillus kimchii]